MALAVNPRGRLLAGDMQQGLLTSEDKGKSWRVVAPTAVMGLDRTLYRTDDRGRTWRPVT
jgi:photosystem II stability/assembly factor-like uncharacterized protein